MRYLAIMALGVLAGPALAQAPAPTPTPSQAPATDGISKAAFQAAARDRMMKADTNSDGKISAAEWTDAAKARGAGQMAERMFARMDANGDGVVDAAELDAMSAQRFARQDSNGDGTLSAAERQARRAAMQEKRGD